MLAFITSLRHPLNSADYQRVEGLLSETLGSVCNQTVRDFVVIIVGNRRPAFDLPDRVHYVNVDFPPPVTSGGPVFPLGPFVWDKGTKIGIGLAAARKFEPTHVMIFDADDFVHRDIAELVRAFPQAPGWVVRDGLIFSRSRQSYRAQKDFNRTCGTCHVVRWDAYAVPDHLSTSATQSEVESAFGDRLHRILGAHRNGVEWLAENGWPLDEMPFRGAVYHVDTGENHSGKGLRGIARPLTSGVAQTYGIPPTASGLRAMARSVAPAELMFTAARLSRRLTGR